MKMNSSMLLRPAGVKAEPVQLRAGAQLANEEVQVDGRAFRRDLGQHSRSTADADVHPRSREVRLDVCLTPGGCVGACALPPKPADDERPSEGTAVQESAATLLRGGAEQGEEPRRSPGPPSRDTAKREPRAPQPRPRQAGPSRKANL
jgi:hypothetical protein